MACVALEDSVNGVVAATAAGMRCIAVPERWPVTDARFGKAQAVIRSLLEVDAASARASGGGRLSVLLASAREGREGA